LQLWKKKTAYQLIITLIKTKHDQRKEEKNSIHPLVFF
jgi:hypothetical protein